MRFNLEKKIFCFFLFMISFGNISGGAGNPPVQGVDKTCQGLRTFGRMYLAFGKLEDAHEYMSRSLLTAQKNKASEEEQALCLSDLAWVFMEKGNYSKAEELWLDTLNIQSEFYGPEHPYVAYTLRSLSMVYLNMGDYSTALDYMTRSLDIMSVYHSETDPAMSPFLADMAKILARQGDLQQPADLYQKAYRTILSSYGSNHLYTAQFLCEYADFALKTNRMSLVGECLDKAKEIYGKFSDHNFSNKISLQITEAQWHEASQRSDEAERLLQKGLEFAPAYLGADPPHNRRIWMHLGRIYYKQGRYKDAEMSFQKAQKCLAERPSNSVFYAEIMYWTAQVKMQQQQYQEAAVLCRNALVGIEKNLLPAHPLYIEIHDFIQERGTPKDNPQAVGRINRPVSTGAIALGRSLLPDVN